MLHLPCFVHGAMLPVLQRPGLIKHSTLQSWSQSNRLVGYGAVLVATKVNPAQYSYDFVG